MNDPVVVPQKNKRTSTQPIMEFMGVRFYMKRSGVGYYNSRDLATSLHRAVWTAANGEIPDGYDIHHRNGDRADNRLENLECIPASEHNREHSSDPAHVERFKRDRDAAQAVLVEKRCEHCGEAYSVDQFNADKSRWCNQYCGFRSKHEAGIYDTEATCAVCGSTFRKNKHFARRSCSDECKRAMISLSRRKLGPFYELED